MIALKYLKKGGGAYADGHPRQSRDRADKKQIKTEGCFMNRFSDCRATMGRFRRHTRKLLDEATASLDVENETLIQESLSRLIENKTVMIIAHRMRTVAGADKIVVLSEGTVAEQGSSDTLLKKNGIYARMVKLQTQSQNWAMK